MASRSLGSSVVTVFRNLDRLVAAIGGVEVDGELDLRIAPQRRVGRHALIDLDRHRRLLHRFIEIGQRQQRQRMIGRKIQRELQIDQREVLAATARQRCADPVKRLGGAGLRRIDQRRQFLASLGLAQAFQYQRMPRELLVERLIDRRRRCRVLVARQPARIVVGHAQHRVLELVGALKAHAGVFFLAGKFKDHRRMQVLEDRVPLGTGQLVDVGDGRFGVACAVTGPARQQRGDQIRDRTAYRLIDVGLRGCVFLLLQIAHADDEPGDAIGLIHRENAVGELDGVVNIAVRERGNEGAIQQFIVLWIDAKRRAIELRRRTCVALDAGVTRGQVTARHRQRFQIVAGRKLRGVVGRMIGRLRRNRAGQRQRSEGNGGNRPTI